MSRHAYRSPRWDKLFMKTKQLIFTWLCTLTFAPCSTRTCTMSYCPAKAAICNAVFPFWKTTKFLIKIVNNYLIFLIQFTLVAASTVAPRFNNSLTTSVWPSFEAKCNAFNPFALQVLMSVPAFKNSSTFSKFPALAARKKLAEPSV